MVYRLEERPRRQPAEKRRSDAQLADARRMRSGALERHLTETRTSLARIASDIRSLLIRRNEAAAMALADRVPARAIAEITGMKAIDVKRVAGSMLHVEFTGTSARVHLDRLAAINSKLAAAIEEKARAEKQLLLAAQEALKNGECDVFRLAAAANMTADRFRELLRRG
ncbi:hypothetical protein F8G81_10325 [Arthrobacter sp. CDRTa11]|uniref:hypothetical protein n=1 Tax=Arthrobacter sp. CDRTa11 TaxID=2651199 RepID=UPI002265BCB1|nr:hypothetical protein [Arthrobacter sp. CDRTa11]UZX02953.1 hypothetical protein F8G81_10325 [Arthrobacter sp. CDRTa11]